MTMSSKKSFTLIELVMVMVILGILAVLSIPKFESYYDIKLSGAARKLVSDIRYAQRMAMARREKYGVEFDAANDRYRVYVVSTDLPARDPFTREDGTATWTGGFVIDYTDHPVYKNIQISAVDFNGGSKLIFSSFGVPQDSSEADLTSAGSVSLSYKGTTRTIQVTPNTGKVTLQ